MREVKIQAHIEIGEVRLAVLAIGKRKIDRWAVDVGRQQGAQCGAGKDVSMAGFVKGEAGGPLLFFLGQ
ncbi:MAG TPA: hypothetical protein EYQ31_15180 [Candidatus Handelsmanbacteria bacterium]|nr:hypothetical protein [Candidatus Handelsmanbacteria bacterium]